MKHTDLPSPGSLSNSLRLRIEMAKAITYVESQSRKRTVLPDQLTTLSAFITSAQAALDAIQPKALVPAPV